MQNIGISEKLLMLIGRGISLRMYVPKPCKPSEERRLAMSMRAPKHKASLFFVMTAMID